MSDDRKSEPILRFAGAAMAFRLESIFGDRPQFRPEDLEGQRIQVGVMQGPDVPDAPGFFLAGTVTEVIPYVDPVLGPGHWVKMS